jgi:hypothetical protein
MMPIFYLLRPALYSIAYMDACALSEICFAQPSDDGRGERIESTGRGSANRDRNCQKV